MAKKVLIAGESWFIYMTHVKGFDTFYTAKYEEGVEPLRKAFINNGIEVSYLPNHLVAEQFPNTLEELKQYDCIIFSDMGANTVLLSNDVFERGQRRPDRLALVKEYVEQGGSFMMVGGYMSFAGIDAKARFGQTAIADILPVACLDIDDRVETPQGVTPTVVKEHPVLAGLNDWPHFLGYNKTKPIAEGEVLMNIGEDPFIAVRKVGKGKTAVFTSDCAPHWGSPEFVAWENYDKLWGNLFSYLTE